VVLSVTQYSMSADQASPKTVGQKAWIATRFVLFGFVGFWVMLGFTVAFASRVLGHDPHFISPFLSLPLALAGAVMVLYGVGEWGRWAYLWVFLSMPISLCLLLLVPGAWDSIGLPLIVAALAAFFSNAGVQIYYSGEAREETVKDERTS
jgi:hypothetical protein